MNWNRSSRDLVSRHSLSPQPPITTIAWTMISAKDDEEEGALAKKDAAPNTTTTVAVADDDGNGKKKKKSEEEVDDIVIDRKSPLFPSSRLLLGTMNCLALLFLYLLRINLSLSMVCMVKKRGNSSIEFLTPHNESNVDEWMETATSSASTILLHLQQTSQSSALANTSPTSSDLFYGSENATAPAASSSSSSVANRIARAVDASHNNYLFDETTNLYGNTTLGEMKEVPEKGEFEWNRQFQGAILSSYFYGYLVTQVLGGFLSGKYGAKHVLGTGMIIMVVMTVLTPTAARLNAYVLIGLRAVLGAAGGVFFPSVQSLWGPWAPPFERSFLVSLTFFGITFGNILALGLSSLFCSLSFDNGWPFTFYTTGAAGFLFWVGWNFCVYSTPFQHPRISAQEKAYILKCIGNKGDSKKIERPPVPWLKILTSPAVMAILTAQTANTWFTHTSITLPFYMKDVLKFDVKQNGMFLILPYIIDIIVTPFVSRLADYLQVKKILRTVTVRKVYQSTSCVVCSVLLITLSFMDYERRFVAVAILCLIYPFQNLYRSGYAVNLQDIAPRFAGEIFGITNTAGTICGIISPVIVGALTTNGTKHEWQTVFFISAGLFIFGGIIFVIFAKGEIQPWANPVKPQVRLIKDEALVENGKEPREEEENGNYKTPDTVPSGSTEKLPLSSESK